MKMNPVIAMVMGIVTLVVAAFGSRSVDAGSTGGRTITEAGIFARRGGASRQFDDTGSPDIFAPALKRALLQSGDLTSSELSRNAASAPLEINLVFHILGGPGSEGDLADEIVDQQVTVVNEAYRTAGIHFNLAKVRRYPDSPYFSGGCFPDRDPGIRMKSELAIDPAHFVNIYSCRLDLPYIAGYGTLPNEFPEADSRHGIVIDYGTVPGNPPPLSLGHTLVHELGHYLGLLHTFQGGCGQPGDDVADTPAEAAPGFGCSVGRDSCPQDGADPVKNFMDYSDDTCTDNFTSLQSARMLALIALYRPSLAYTASSAPASAPALSTSGLVVLGLLLLTVALLVPSFRSRF